ncbi:hypothetical protein BKA70DRAFT_1237680 [Coprinopsis sp. MPI-PUGE-AT-0042]|nr:hypothetical protein BKA70DRAFT_1237680 [Coprinopsis sp. MPI-PUGE-AT-0042]
MSITFDQQRISAGFLTFRRYVALATQKCWFNGLGKDFSPVAPMSSSSYLFLPALMASTVHHSTSTARTKAWETVHRKYLRAQDHDDRLLAGTSLVLNEIGTNYALLGSFLDMLLSKLNDRKALGGLTREKKSLYLKTLACITEILFLQLKNSGLLQSHSFSLFRVTRSMRNRGPILESGLLEALVNSSSTCDWKGEEEIDNGISSSRCSPLLLAILSSIGAAFNLLLPQLDWRCVQPSASSAPMALVRPSRSAAGVAPCPIAASRVQRKTGYLRIASNALSCDKRSQVTAISLHEKHATTPSECPHIHARAFYLALATKLVNNPGFQAPCKLKNKRGRYSTYNMLMLYSWDAWHEQGHEIGVCAATESRSANLVQEAKFVIKDDKEDLISAFELLF